MLNFIIIHRTVVRYNVFQQGSKPWDVPLAIAQFVKMLTVGVVGSGYELHIEGPARRDSPQLLVENDRGFANGVDHCLRKSTSVFNLTELLFEHCRPLQPVRDSENSAVYFEGIAEIDGTTISTHLRSSTARF